MLSVTQLIGLLAVLLLIAFFSFVLFTDVNGAIRTIVRAWSKSKLDETRTRRLEALAKMQEPDRQRLIASMPDWLDKDDAEDVEAWKAARVETNKVKG